jgi:hypothetical protein
MRTRSESGQVVPLTLVVMLTVLLGMCALVIDVGAWFTRSRKLQSVADAAALAAAQDLPASPSAAVSDAESYAQANGYALTSTPVVSTTSAADDTVSVATTASAPIFFAGILGIHSATVHAHAVAEVSGASTVSGSGIDASGTGRPIPLVVSASSVPPAGAAYGQTVTLEFGSSDKLGAGEFGLLDFAGGGNASPKTIASWIADGYPGSLGIGTYGGVKGNKTMSGPVNDAMSELAQARPTIVLPVYTSVGDGTYSIDGWAAFAVQSWSKGSGNSELTGSWVRLELPVSGASAEYFGAGSIGLVG